METEARVLVIQLLQRDLIDHLLQDQAASPIEVVELVESLQRKYEELQQLTHCAL